ncbi:ABC-three component system protein [Marinibacterium profundimaris]|uniref:ABC-three component system protein n=1 Tax=Marinibacterium profundimaris TaxID=1679460 RepID=UPI0011808DBA|nr:ABC-three component system protein [Marinibacterium profundimaris]
MTSQSQHDATASALGFRYQERFALLQLLETNDDEAAVAVEALDDVQLKANGVDILEQLKHSLVPNPKPLTIKSVNLWTTFRIWCELLPNLDLECTKFALIAVAPIASNSTLRCLETEGSDRASLSSELQAEAKRVIEDVETAEPEGRTKPHKKKASGAAAFLALSESQRASLLQRVSIQSEVGTISSLEGKLAQRLDTYPKTQRATLAAKLGEWWDRQMLLSFDGKRDRFIKRYELLEQLSEISAMLTSEALLDSFSSKQPPPVFDTHEMLAKQCELVEAKPAMVKLARISEWQARNQRAAWSIEAPSKNSKIVEYDERLVSEWTYRHESACENTEAGNETELVTNGQSVLRWVLEEAAQEVGTIESTVTSPFYVRGSYQVLSIEGRVGWHPDYRKRLGFSE